MATNDSGTPRAAELMREAFDAIAAKDLDRLAKTWDAQSTDNFIALGIEVTGESDLRTFFAELFAALPDLTMSVEDIHDVDERTAVGQWRMQGTFSGGPFQGIQPTGRTVDLRGIDVMRFENGVLRHNDVYYDGLAFARQIGLLPAAESRGDRALMAGFNAFTKAKDAVRERMRNRQSAEGQ